MNEFDLIQHFFLKQKIKRQDVTLGIGDDAALLSLKKGQSLVITTDTMVEGVHFKPHTHPAHLGHKILAVNLSDLAAMGATPAWVTLALTLPEANPAWLEAFGSGFFSLAEQFQVELIGGDLTRGPLSMTVGAYGLVPPGLALRRDTAKPLDKIFVSNTLGDAAFGLTSANPFFLKKLETPIPEITLGESLRNTAHACIDVSDGLIADLSHILAKSGVGATIFTHKIPLSEELKKHTDYEKALTLALSGGDDYVLCFTVPPKNAHKISSKCTEIGFITENPEFRILNEDSSTYSPITAGYQHF
jgi:thiamine-monophosphate kinase